MKVKPLLVSTLIFLLLTGCANEEGVKRELDKEVTIIAPSSTGGGWDVTVRAIKKILLQENILDDIEVINKVGAGGEVGWKYTYQQQENVLAMNSSLIITNHLLGQSKLTFEDFTPIATLAKEWEVVIVSKDSSINRANTLLSEIKQAPEQYKIGISPRLGNDDQLSFVLASKQYGIQPKNLQFRIYENSDEVVKALISKEIEVATMSISEAKKYYDRDQVKLLVISADKRLKELPELPTWKEEGIDIVFQHWRGIMGPPNMSKEEIEFWNYVFGEMVKTEAWKKTLEHFMWEDFYKDSEETYKYLKEQSMMYEQLMGVH
ncbi:tripartite tricarboxylate transporter substrate binding protein [Metabacillus halosaccharovorans]|uniref:Tripartite tricarboxylate transporter substrate-binding protein n=1 Tax=Metabacillus halosaccharovorans TaxID=930124 RepID=A0ABT3DLE1_9BACI|nr:tripartite tricarboxylate transporter substrate-binding protein [Metabacillus halosaccharovorans]MCV9887855.1 tripartite tricarboxylate transporter substrate-binding protein [Metabacillus halosaccharovorans]